MTAKCINYTPLQTRKRYVNNKNAWDRLNFETKEQPRKKKEHNNEICDLW
jgi:hypothetical protein